MKKFFGVVLIIIGVIWTVLFLSIFTAYDAVEFLVSTFLVAIGAAGIFIGIKLLKSKSKKQPQQTTSENQPNIPPKPQTPVIPQSETKKQQVQPQTITLDQIRQLTAQKIASTESVEGQSTAAQLAKALHLLNDPKLPFSFEGCSEKGIDMVGHWRLADTEYLGMLGLNKHDLQAKFDVLMKFDELYHVVRCKDKMYRKEARMGFGGMGMEMSTFSGKSTSKQREITFGRKKDGSIGKVVDISLDTTILQNAIKEVAQKHGWEVKRVAGKL